LGGVVNRAQSKPLSVIHSRTGTDNAFADGMKWKDLDAPAVMRPNSRRDATIEAMKQSGVDVLDIPAFLRKQAD
jgi:cell division protein FtsZ